MLDRLTLPLLSVLVLSGVFLNASPSPAAEAGPSDQQLWAEAQARIEQHRKADATILVTDADGKPASGAEVQVEQTRHAFLFGCNIFAWGRVGDEAGEAAYRQRFADVFNFATLPFYWWTYEAASRPADPRADRASRPLVPASRHRLQRPSAGLELRRTAVVAGRFATGAGTAAARGSRTASAASPA